MKYIENHPNAIVIDIITETGVSLKSINCLVEQGSVSYIDNKLELKDDKVKKKLDNLFDTKNKFHYNRFK